MSAGWLKAPDGIALGRGADNLADDGTRVVTEKCSAAKVDLRRHRLPVQQPRLEMMPGGAARGGGAGRFDPELRQPHREQHTTALRRPHVEGHSIESALPDFMRAGRLGGWVV